MSPEINHSFIPAILQWTIGKKRVTVIHDSNFTASDAYFTNLPDGGIDLLLQNAYRPHPPVMTFNVFLIEAEDHPPVLIDVGMGTKLAPAINGQLLESLAYINIKPEDIGVILLTHLHGDHYYGLLSDQGQRNFPNAKVWVSALESAYWFDNETLSEPDRQNAADARQALQLYDKLNTAEDEPVPGFTPVALPGHTPGQTGFLMHSDGEELLFCADIISLPALQAALPQIGFATDADPGLAAKTRINTLQDAADRRLLLAGAHFEYPGLHYVQKDNAGFRLVAKQWL